MGGAEMSTKSQKNVGILPLLRILIPVIILALVYIFAATDVFSSNIIRILLRM